MKMSNASEAKRETKAVSHEEAVNTIKNLRNMLVSVIKRGELESATRKAYQLFPLLGILLGMSFGRPEMDIVREAIEEAALEIRKVAQEAEFGDIVTKLDIFTRNILED